MSLMKLQLYLITALLRLTILLIRKKLQSGLQECIMRQVTTMNPTGCLIELEINSGFYKIFIINVLYFSADLYIKQKRYAEAIDPLEKSIELVSGKRTRYRLTYLLAQLYEQTGNGSKASTLYRKVVKMNPPYDVEFNARINIAGVFDINSGDPQEMSRDLEKMLKNSKNKDFQDQIYFALGNLSMKEGDVPGALELL